MRRRVVAVVLGVLLAISAAVKAFELTRYATLLEGVGFLEGHEHLATALWIYVEALAAAALLLAGLSPRPWRKRTRVLASVVVVLLSLRIAAPYVVEAGLDDALAHLPDHWGSVQDVDLALYRGRYTINDLNILERSEEELEHPLLSIGRADIELDWKALLDGEIDARVDLENARVSIVVAETTVQKGESPALRQQLLDFVPLDISRFEVTKGRLRFVDLTEEPRVDVDVRDISVTATGLSTRPVPGGEKRGNEKTALPARITARGSMLGRAPVSLDVRLDALAEPHPRFDAVFEMETLPLEALNDVTRAYGKFDFEAGTISLYSEVAAADGAVDGYLKPLIANRDVVDTDGNDEGDNVAELAWEAFVGAVAAVLENRSSDRVATRIPIEGRFDQPDVGTVETLVNLVGNAFFRAIAPDPDDSISIENVIGATPRG